MHLDESQIDSGSKIGVLGVSGYAGGELARLLLAHPRLHSAAPHFYSRSADPNDAKTVTLAELHPNLATAGSVSSKVVPFSWDLVTEAKIRILFLATPHQLSRDLVPEALARGIRVIDLSGAWRLKQSVYRDVYQLTDTDPQLAAKIQSEAVFGSPELHHKEIVAARIVANPGCYATSIILAVAPLVHANALDLGQRIICDAKSGVSGAGKAANSKTHFMNAADNLSAYNVFGHRHLGELFEQLELGPGEIQFTPHLLPIPRGILSTIYVRLRKQSSSAEVGQYFHDFYKNSPLVRLRETPQLPQIKDVVRTNYCDIGFELGPDGKSVVLISCLDNLLKGAAGQAVQNMNLMCGFRESEGLL